MDRPPEVRPETYECPQGAPYSRARPWVVVPCSYDADEPLAELQQATRMLPEVTFFMTWYREKLPPAFARNVGPNVIFTGFLPQSQFDALLAHADLILVLTTRDGTQPSGASEALAFGKALVISDLQIIRSLFPAGAVYTNNQASAIAKGIRTGLSQKSQLETEMKTFLAEKTSRWGRQFDELSKALAGVSHEIG
jgi:glycosyltransferase involved in cell wall biosynthesis